MRNDLSHERTKPSSRLVAYFASGILGALAGAVLLLAAALLLLLFFAPFLASSWTALFFVYYGVIPVAVLGAVLGAWWWLRQAYDGEPFEHLGLLGAGLAPVLLIVANMIGLVPAASTAQVMLMIAIGFSVGSGLANRSSFRTWLAIGTLSLFVMLIVPAFPHFDHLLALVLFVAFSFVVWLRLSRD